MRCCLEEWSTISRQEFVFNELSFFLPVVDRLRKVNQELQYISIFTRCFIFVFLVHSREVDKFLSTQKFTNPLITESDSVTELKLQQKQQQQQYQEPDRHQVADDQISSINESVLSESPVSHITGFSPGMDPDIARMETLMEQWLGDLKRNVLVSLQFEIFIQEMTFRFFMVFITILITILGLFILTIYVCVCA